MGMYGDQQGMWGTPGPSDALLYSHIAQLLQQGMPIAPQKRQQMADGNNVIPLIPQDQPGAVDLKELMRRWKEVTPGNSIEPFIRNWHLGNPDGPANEAALPYPLSIFGRAG